MASTPDPSPLTSNSLESEREAESDTQSVVDESDSTGNGGSVDNAGTSEAGAGTGDGAVPDTRVETPQLGRQDTGRSSSGGGDDDKPVSTYGPANRASYLRRKARRGALTDDERGELTVYEATRGRGKGKKAPATRERRDRNGAAPVPDVIPRVARVGSPPIVHETEHWRKKYIGGAESGRELLCTMLGDQWHQMLILMEKQIADAGMTPICEVSNQSTRDMLVLAVDDMIPDWVKATPIIVAAFKTTALTTQRVVKSRAIKEALEKKGRAVSVLRAAPVSEPAPPPPTETEEPAVAQTPAQKEIGNVAFDSTGRLLGNRLPVGAHVIR